MRNEQYARLLIISVVAVSLALTGFGLFKRSQGTLIHARMAETGGWTPGNLTARVGEPLHLRLTSDDVLHGFAIGQSTQPAVDVVPGEISKVTLTFDQPGKYTYYCTRWCSINHWRMRGVIDVIGEENEHTTPDTKRPLYVELGLDLDIAHHADHIPDEIPSARRGQGLVEQLSPGAIKPDFLERQTYLTNSPEDLWAKLREEQNLKELSDQELWDTIAWIWSSHATSEGLASGKQLYSENCAACHGENGAGDGVFAEELVGEKTDSHTQHDPGEMTVRPASFSDPDHMLDASPALLQGKILRGGMGTGMPYWGPIFSEEQMWDIVSYLYTFIFTEGRE